MKRLPALSLIASLTLLCSTGCQSIMHELQPHRLWRLNYQEPLGRTDGVYFSMQDSLDEPVPTANGETTMEPVVRHH